jgi:hypothetical protein
MKYRKEDCKSPMAPSGISQPHSRSRRRPDRRALQARIERALRELPLTEADIAAVAPQLTAGLLRFHCGSQDDSPFFDMRGKITAVCDHFAGEGLTLPDYVRAACRCPQLFVKAPASLIANVRAVAHLFQAHGLTLRAYLQSCLRSPPLFAMSPATVIANVEAIVHRFAGDGLTLRHYLQAALQQPQLFYQSPATIIRHLGYLIEMYRQGLLSFPGEVQAPPEQPLAPLFAFLSRSPLFLTLADDNYELRLRYAQVTGARPAGTKLLSLPRRRIEEELARALHNARHGRQ